MLVALCLLTTASCMPTLNWRETSPDQAGFVILMPSKPDRLNRSIDLNGLKVTMNMLGSKVDQVAYTVAWVDTVSAADAVKAVDSMRIGMMRNLGQKDIPGLPTKVAIRGGNTSWPALKLDIKSDQQHMSAIFLQRGARAWQVVTVAPKLDPEASKIFLESFALLPE
jgi:hypothetical protein